MVEPPLFDIYLCDYCDAELYSLEACQEHEKNCRETSEQGLEDDDSDVILCEDPLPTESTIAGAVKRRGRKRPLPPKEVKPKSRKLKYEEVDVLDSPDPDDEDDSNDGVPPTGEDDKDNQMRSFLSHFQLVSAKGVPAENWPKQRSPRKSGGGGARSPIKLPSALEKGKRRRTDRSVLTLQKCATVPLSSPMGKFVLKTQKTVLTSEYMMERNDRLERFCTAPVMRDGVRPRWLTQAAHSETLPVTYRTIDYRGMFEKDEGYDPKYVHQFRFPRRQWSNRSRELSWMALTQVLLKQCRPCTVELQRLTDSDIRMYFLHLAIERTKRELMALRRADMIRLMEKQRNQLKRPPDDYIDLCSSDEEGQVTEGAKTQGEVVVRKPGPKRQRLDEGEKENMIVGGMFGISPRSHSAIQWTGGGGSAMLSKQLTVSTVTSTQYQGSLPAGSPQTAAQMGVVLASPPGPMSGNAKSNNNNSTAGLVEQPSSYLFLTKQQLVYQQLEVTSTVAEGKVVPGHEVEEEVVTTTSNTTEAALVAATGEENLVTSTIPSNSVLAGGRTRAMNNGELPETIAKELGKRKAQDKVPVVEQNISSSNKVTARKSLPVRRASQEFGAHSGGATSVAGPRLRRTSVVESFGLPKKLPSLIRIAPA